MGMRMALVNKNREKASIKYMRVLRKAFALSFILLMVLSIALTATENVDAARKTSSLALIYIVMSILTDILSKSH